MHNKCLVLHENPETARLPSGARHRLAEGEAARQAYASARFPVLALSITDDELMTLRGTHNLINLYENAPRQIERIAPADLAVRRLGHFGPFRKEHEAKLWPRIAQWLGGLSQRAAA